MNKTYIIVVFFSILVAVVKILNIYLPHKVLVNDNDFIKKDFITLNNGCYVFRPESKFVKILAKEDLIYCGGADGLTIIDIKENKLIQLPSVLKNIKLISDLEFDKEGNLWLASYLGLFVYKINGELEDKTNYLPAKKVLSLFMDKNSSMWVGTYDGVGKFEEGKWYEFAQSDKLLHKNVNVIFIDSQNGLWFGSYVAPYGGLSYYDGAKWHYYNVENGLPHNNVVTIFEDREQNIWVGTGFHDKGGLSLFTKCEFSDGKIVNGNFINAKASYKLYKNFYKNDGLAGEKCRSVFQDSSGMYWFGSEFSGFAIYKSGKWNIFDDKHGFLGNEIMDIYEDRSYNIWLATNKGITLIPSEIVEKLRKCLL